MANQPKKYKKFVATAATATLVASAIVPVASAAGFSDVAGNDHEVAINALVEAGIINGYADGTFKPNQSINRGQVVKLLGRWLEAQGQEIPADWETKQRFTDLPVTAEAELVKYAALAKDAGVFAGSNGNLNHTQTMQRQQMAVVLVRAIKETSGVDLVADYKKAGFVTEISDLEAAFSAEQRNAIVALEYAGITNVSKFNPANSITRGQFASFLHRTINNVMEPEAGVSTVKAINNTTVEVTFDTEVDNVQALNFLISDLEVKNAAVKQTNKKVVVLTTAAQTADKEYTVSLGEDKIGTFKGIVAVIPTKVDIVEKSVQGKLGQQVTVKAQVTVAEGASKAGIPVTLFVPGSNDGIKAPVTVEALTDENGVATHTYTRYAATTDTLTVYATGDRSKFSTGYVFWGVDSILKVEEVTTGATINNNSNKTYKVTYNHPTTGKPVANKELNVSFVENINVAPNEAKNATVNGLDVRQLTNNTIPKTAVITTDSKGEATFTVSGANTEVTPVIFELNTDTTNGKDYASYYEADLLQVTAAKVKFGALQAQYSLELTRDGGEYAAFGDKNGRKYKVLVKDKDGKVAKNEIVNIAFNEDLDRVISTNTKAKFVKLDSDGKQVKFYDKTPDNGNTQDKITVKTNANGEAEFVIGSENGNTNDYATPVAWIDINSSNAKDGQLDEGEPTTIGKISYFEAAKLTAGKLVSVDAATSEDKEKFKGNESAEFKFQLTNQSGKKMPITDTDYDLISATYTVTNTGDNDVEVTAVLKDGKTETKTVSPNRDYTVTVADSASPVITVKPANSEKSAAVKVTANAIVKDTATNGLKPFTISTTSETKASFTGTKEVGNLEKGIIESFDTDKQTFTIAGKNAVKYADVTGKTFIYRDTDNRPVSLANFEKALKDAATAVEITYEVKGDETTFYLKSVSGTPPINTVEATAVDTSVSSIKVKNVAAIGSGTTYNVVFPVGTVLADIKAEEVVVTTNNSGAKVAAATKNADGTIWTVEVTAKDGKTKATYTINASVSATVLNTAKVTTAAVQGKPAVGTVGDLGKATVSGVTFTATAAAPGNGDGIEVELVVGTPTAEAEAAYNSTDNKVTVTIKATATQTDVVDAIDALATADKVVTATAAAGGTTVVAGSESTTGGYVAPITAVDGTLTLTFSEAVETLAVSDALNLTIDGATIVGSVATVSTDKKVITVTHAYHASAVVGKALTAIKLGAVDLKDAGGNAVTISNVLSN
ncbi:S-layer homology domain-containing protein [Lysinibacillus sp. NPDC048646]|uniref:S-layer homology domain-containing protein n=1 Tax=Lysinibacillus sp. NPDC048646 TaxID=3390574 RepID=UPI003D03C1BA